MVEFNSQTALINKSISEVYTYLCSPANYESLMPTKVRSFQEIENGAKLDIEGIGNVELVFSKKEEPKFIEFIPQNKVPFEFNLQWELEEVATAQTRIKAKINAKLNFMMRMMAEKLLVNFLDVQVAKLQEKLNHE